MGVCARTSTSKICHVASPCVSYVVVRAAIIPRHVSAPCMSYVVVFAADNDAMTSSSHGGALSNVVCGRMRRRHQCIAILRRHVYRMWCVPVGRRHAVAFKAERRRRTVCYMAGRVHRCEARRRGRRSIDNIHQSRFRHRSIYNIHRNIVIGAEQSSVIVIIISSSADLTNILHPSSSS